MFSNQTLETRRIAGLAALALALAACSNSGPLQPESAGAEPSSAAPSEPAAEAAPAEELTATEAATTSGAQASEASGATPSPAVFRSDAPRSYTVKRGDTLWDISTMFLRDPWLWPEVWQINPQVDNPHLIYPGDVLALAYGADGSPQVRLERGGAARLNPRLRSSPLDGAIPVLPYSDIAAFLSRPAMLTADEIRKAPHVVAFRDRHMIAGEGHEAYVRNLQANLNDRYSIMHIGEEIHDPDDGDLLGYTGIYTATALVMNPGDPTKVQLTDTARETLEGDRLFSSDTSVPANFVPSAPKGDVRGSIVSVVDGTRLIGQYQIVVINRGQRHGLEVGNVLAIDQAGEVVRDRFAGDSVGALRTSSTFAPKVQLPEERTGTLLVFKTYDRASYGLVVGASSAIQVLDVVRTP